MKLKPHRHADLLFLAELENADAKDQYAEDSLGVGAMMPYEISDFMFLAETESYGI